MNKPNFYLQWHITDRCSQRCRHCYLYQSKNIIDDCKKELDIDILSLIAEDMYKTALRLNANPVFVLTGGDPIMHPNFWKILDEINTLAKRYRSKVAIDILGNPFLITKKIADNLKSKGVKKYQLSLDGLEEKHDFLRKKGSYQSTLKAVNILKESGIKTNCMFTLSKFNAPDLIGVMKKVVENKFHAFTFARFCKPNTLSIKEYGYQMFTPEEYRSLLKNVDRARKELSMFPPQTKFVFKDHLWELYFYESSEERKRETERIKERGIVIGGCSLGVASLSVLSDGTVYACRRFESPLGKVPEQKLLDLFIESKKLNCFRKIEQHQKCKNCPLLYVCRGCGAVSYGMTGDFFSPDPQCWHNPLLA